ncbi:hypothetical protein QNH39_25690 [Neobacillus novalis]|uniref:Uncharacterized protein n=1 Tax=Neobacillus novalis TaxID=220687 RepID=A0AA95MPY6_9BACI|nr:hypothetical protein [Neobacillus novalis]WHY85928.1 hypothetical protein QNH39_25690 [Neobacillus novalis]
MKKGRILIWVGLLLSMVGVYIQTFLSSHWFIIGTLIALFGCLLLAISLYLPRSNGGAGIKLKKTNVLGCIIFLFWSICVFFFKEELSIITTGLGGLICLIISMTLILKGLDKH